MSEDTKVEISASDLPDGILQAQKVVGKHNLCHDLADYTDELKGYTPPEKDNSGSIGIGVPVAPSKNALIDRIISEHRNCHDKIAEYPECCDDFYTGDLDNTLEAVDRAVFKIAKAQARRAENDRCDEAKSNTLLDKLMGAFKGDK
jgi:hypothetical protein